LALALCKASTRTALLGLTLAAAACGAAQASPFVIRYGGSNTALAIDQGSIGSSGAFRSAMTYQLFRTGSMFMSSRLQILATRQVVNCKTRLAKSLGTVGYLANGARISATGPDPGWTENLRGSNTDLILTTMCEGPDPAWSRVRAATVFDVYRATWRR
jgi:hypothetical protein